MNKPDFIGIGGTRCGSTWLHAKLAEHPQIWLSPIKEISYFDRSINYLSPSYLSDGTMFQRLFERRSYRSQWRKKFLRSIAVSLYNRSINDFLWTFKYFLGPYTDDWYQSLFPQDEKLICGDITPAYSILNEADVGKVFSVNPDAKVIFIMRDPVERSWSSSTDVSRLSEAEHLKRVLSFNHQVRSDYLRTLRIWESQFPSEQIYHAFFDDIVMRPDWLFSEVCDFLQIDSPSASLLEGLRSRVNPTPNPVHMPDAVRRALSEEMLPSLQKLACRFSGHPAKWLRKAEDSLSRK